MNVRTRVNGYGGGAFTVYNHTLFFSNYDDNAIYRQDGPEAIPQQLTNTSYRRYADGSYSPQVGKTVERRRTERTLSILFPVLLFFPIILSPTLPSSVLSPILLLPPTSILIPTFPPFFIYRSVSLSLISLTERCLCLQLDALFLVVEDHELELMGEATESECGIVMVDARDGAEKVVAAHADFFTSPRVSQDGRLLAWVQWNHPQMVRRRKESLTAQKVLARRRRRKKWLPTAKLMCEIKKLSHIS